MVGIDTLTEARKNEINAIIQRRISIDPIEPQTDITSWLVRLYQNTINARGMTMADKQYVTLRVRSIHQDKIGFDIVPVDVTAGTPESRVNLVNLEQNKYDMYNYPGCTEQYTPEELHYHATHDAKNNGSLLFPLSRLRGDAQNKLMVPFNYLIYIFARCEVIFYRNKNYYISYEKEEELQGLASWREYSSAILEQALRRANGDLVSA